MTPERLSATLARDVYPRLVIRPNGARATTKGTCMNGPTIFRQPHHDRPNVISRYWSPQVPGESISGWFLGVATEQTQFGPAEMFGICDPQMRERLVGLSVGLDDQQRALKLRRGQGVTLTYFGDRTDGKRGRLFKLEVAAAFNNGSVLSASDSEAAIMGTAALAPNEDAPPS